jgi:hypothetical protein
MPSNFFATCCNPLLTITAYLDDEISVLITYKICMNLKLWIIFVRAMCKMLVQTAYTYMYIWVSVSLGIFSYNPVCQSHTNVKGSFCTYCADWVPTGSCWYKRVRKPYFPPFHVKPSDIFRNKLACFDLCKLCSACGLYVIMSLDFSMIQNWVTEREKLFRIQDWFYHIKHYEESWKESA